MIGRGPSAHMCPLLDRVVSSSSPKRGLPKRQISEYNVEKDMAKFFVEMNVEAQSKSDRAVLIYRD